MPITIPRHGRAFLIVLLAVLPGNGRAAPAEPAGAKAQYDHCISLAALNPAAALGVAGEWARAHGGPAAEHCSAVALVGLKRYSEAAVKLDALGQAPGVGDLRASLFDQAGNAWLLAGDADHAVVSFRAALTLSGSDPDLYADLAQAEAARKNWPSVEAELNAALAIAPRRADLLVLRASARQAMGNLKAAGADVDWALMLKPGAPEALVERGSIARDRGDMKAARADFEAVLKQGQVGEAADAAQRNLQALDAAAAKAPHSKKR